jgi:hypothetical protein
MDFVLGLIDSCNYFGKPAHSMLTCVRREGSFAINEFGFVLSRAATVTKGIARLEEMVNLKDETFCGSKMQHH